ncbi:MAG TPA: hypothetical protein VHM94_02535 [Acidimicrobiia bacterium]|jgi:hypothetical protein|nr:hypothetical protein [Acidimicrobiia bacterium]
MAPLFVAASLGVSTLLWALRLALPGTFIPQQSAVLLALDLLVVTTVSISGLLVAHGRWARRLGWVALGMHGIAAAITQPDPLWWVGLAGSGIAAVAWAGPWLRGWVRLFPAATGPPARAVLLALGLLLLPAVVALTNPSGPGWQGWLLAAGSLLLAALYARAVMPMLWVLRLGLIPLAVPAVIVAPLWGAVVLAAAVMVLAGLAWSADARLAVAPLVAGPPPRLPTQGVRTPVETGTEASAWHQSQKEAGNEPSVLPRPRLRRRDEES